MRWVFGAITAALLLGVLANREYREQFFFGAGVAKGALIAAIALGVVLTYRGSGVVNLANGAIATYVAYVYYGLRSDGSLLLPPLPNPLAFFPGHPNIPTSISLGNAMSFWPALIISLLFCVLFGLILHFLVFRPLRHAPALAKVVASIGVLLFLQATAIRRFTLTSQTMPQLPSLNPSHQINFGLFKLSEDKVFVAAVVIVLTIALWAVFKWTRFGLATRAAAENEKGAVVLGFSPDFLAGTNWVLSTVITGLLGIMCQSILRQLNPTTVPAIIIPAVVAALVGSFRSFGITTAAAFVLGMQEQLIKHFALFSKFAPKSGKGAYLGVEYLLPLVVVILVLFLFGNALPERGAISSGRLPFAPTPPKWALRIGGPVLAVGAALSGMFLLGPDYRGALTNSLIGIIVCLSVVVITGFVGQISLAQMAFAGISSFFVAHLTTEHGWPFPLPILAGGFLALIVGLVVALPALRVRGVNLAIVTFAFAVTVQKFIFENPSVNAIGGGYHGAPVVTPGWMNINRTKPFHVLGIKIGDGTQPNPMTAMFCLIVVVILCYLVANLRRSTTGRQMLSIRSNERAAAAAGVNVSGTKILAFGISAFIAGVAGAVLAYSSGNASKDKFDYLASLTFFAFAYLGGISSVSGAIAGGLLVPVGIVFTFLESTLGVPDEFTLLLGGLGLVVAAVQNPEGIAGRIRSEGLRLIAYIRQRQRPRQQRIEGPPADVAVRESV